MATGRVLSAQTGRGRDAEWAGRLRRTAIDKRQVLAPARVGALGLDGDEQADLDNHGGMDKAVYVYAREDLDWWAEQLGRDLRDGMFGENLTTAGVDVSAALIGAIWRVGTAVLQVTGCRIPCVVFQNWIGEPRWVKRFAAAGRPGAYLRVLAEGMVGPGDEVEVLDSPAERVTVAESMRAYYGDAELMRALLKVPGRARAWDEAALSALGSEAAGAGG